MPTPPLRSALSATYPNPSNAVMRTGMGALWDYITTLLGATGTAADARTALGLDAPTFSGAATAAKFVTGTASNSIPNGVATGVYILPVAATPAMYLVSANVGAVADAPNYSAFAIVAIDSSSTRIVMAGNATLLSITLSGRTINVTQNSGTTTTATVTVTRIG